MIETTLIEAVAQVGFPVAVAIFLLYKGYTQDKEYLKALQDLATLMRDHVEQKDVLLTLLQKSQDDLRDAYLELKKSQ